MKTILFVVAFLFSVPILAADARSFDFEMEPGCMWSKDKGRCIVSNRSYDPIRCKVTVTGETFRGTRIGNTQIVTVAARRFDDSPRIQIPAGDVLVNVRASADCKAL